ncbi:hypothetical protein PN36_28245 [Candidatus Thiomargarita nelsonii]|uniref:Uncharacterized protein n=1 Tax=Candidatus Thiomargarita nelsonii TaxID=1003181 RepID=A0A4E0QSH9_9GAMM|nr:hypothetical protein PN36_28245 [Candidatus Thiomargarita nelsonii]
MKLTLGWPRDAIQAAFQPNGTQPLPGYVISENSDELDMRLQLLRPKRGKDGQAINVNDALPMSFANCLNQNWQNFRIGRIKRQDTKSLGF